MPDVVRWSLDARLNGARLARESRDRRSTSSASVQRLTGGGGAPGVCFLGPFSDVIPSGTRNARHSVSHSRAGRVSVVVRRDFCRFANKCTLQRTVTVRVLRVRTATAGNSDPTGTRKKKNCKYGTTCLYDHDVIIYTYLSSWKCSGEARPRERNYRFRLVNFSTQLQFSAAVKIVSIKLQSAKGFEIVRLDSASHQCRWRMIRWIWVTSICTFNFRCVSTVRSFS